MTDDASIPGVRYASNGYVNNNPLTFTDPTGFEYGPQSGVCIGAQYGGCNPSTPESPEAVVEVDGTRISYPSPALMQLKFNPGQPSDAAAMQVSGLGNGLSGSGAGSSNGASAWHPPLLPPALAKPDPATPPKTVPKTPSPDVCTNASVRAPSTAPMFSVTGGEILAATGTLTDTATALATFLNETGSSVSGVAGSVVRGAPFVAAPISGVTLLHGIQTGNSQEQFDGGYGLSTLGVAVFFPNVALGMSLAKIVSDIATPATPSTLDLASSLPLLSGCTMR